MLRTNAPLWAASSLFICVHLAFAAPAAQIGGEETGVNLEALLGSGADEVGSMAEVFPAGTKVDRVELSDGILHVDLTLSSDMAQWRISPVDAEEVGHRVAAPFLSDSAIAGTLVRVRVSPEADYRPLGSFVDQVTEQPSEEAVVPDLAVSELSERTFTSPDPLRGGFSHAARQPAGALSGVVVYCSGGHGWTAGDESWILQRPVLWTMNEDHGNLDQLNYFARYAYNAGATVVPFRPVGYQEIEIVLDNDDPGVAYSGSWFDGTGGKYYENGTTVSGVPYRAVNADGVESATARFTPNIPTTGFYPVYAFTLAGTNRVPQLYRVGHSGGVTEITIDHRDVGNGWIWLGEYYLEAGGDNYVEISNEAPIAGAVIADAIRWGNGIGDIVRPGPGTVSGHARHEEAHRYWAHGELGNNAVGFTAEDIWDSSSSDQNDSVSTASRWAREMNQVPAGGNQVDRWKRIYLEFHSNALNGAARGCIGLISASAPTTNQPAYAAAIADEIDQDMLILDDTFEHTWVDRVDSTYTAEFGAISTVGNSNEFDATIIEVAFHDNEQDAQLLRDSRVRAALAKSSVQGIIRFLSGLPGSPVPLAFPPDTPRNFRVIDAGNGDVQLSWSAPLTGQAYGDAATGYVVYSSTNGYGFTTESVLGNVGTTTVSGIAAGETRYFRVAATNSGGESMPTQVLAFRRPASGTASVLIVDGFDRLRRQQNPTQDINDSPIERQMWQWTNSFDYAVQFAQALDATTAGCSSSSNEAVSGSLVLLGDFDIALWILGTESTEDATLDATERSLLQTFLDNGGGLFISGAELGFHLIGGGAGASFMQNTLATGYVADDAGTSGVSGAPGGIFSDVGAFDFAFDNGAPYEVKTPDVLSAQTGGAVALNYAGGAGVAGVQNDVGTYRTVTFGFPFEAITDAVTRDAVMQRVIAYLEDITGPVPFDFDDDGDVDLSDYALFGFCIQGPTFIRPNGHICLEMDGDGDNDVDLADFALFQRFFTGPSR